MEENYLSSVVSYLLSHVDTNAKSGKVFGINTVVDPDKNPDIVSWYKFKGIELNEEKEDDARFRIVLEVISRKYEEKPSDNVTEEITVYLSLSYCYPEFLEEYMEKRKFDSLMKGFEIRIKDACNKYLSDKYEGVSDEV